MWQPGWQPTLDLRDEQRLWKPGSRVSKAVTVASSEVLALERDIGFPGYAIQRGHGSIFFLSTGVVVLTGKGRKGERLTCWVGVWESVYQVRSTQGGLLTQTRTSHLFPGSLEVGLRIRGEVWGLFIIMALQHLENCVNQSTLWTGMWGRPALGERAN